MARISEVEALKALDDALAGLEDPQARDRVLRWAWEKYSTRPAPADEEEDAEDPTPARSTPRRKKAATKKKASKSGGKKKSSLSIEKDLNLKPRGKKSFNDFVAEKQPNANHEKCTVAVYYLRHELSLEAVGASHVFTCFKHMQWRVPANLPNTLAWTASNKGLLDTRKMDDIKVTTIGENLVEHDLPAKPKK